MKCTKRFIGLLEKVDHFFEKCLRLFTAKDVIRTKLCKAQDKAPVETETPAQGSDASEIDEILDLVFGNSSGDAPDDAADDTNDSNCNNDNQNPGDTGSDAGSVSGDSWFMETPPFNLNYDALKHVATYFLPGSHGACIDISTLQHGMFHEIRVLHFKDGWTCIGRFTREPEPLAKVESELATLEYVRKHTTIPVPAVYLANHSDNDCVGAPFVLMEHMPGSPLDDIWEGLSLDHELDAIEQLAAIHGQLASQKFDSIGSLKPDESVGPYRGPLYFLCEYPLNVQDPEFSHNSHVENKILRKHFVRCLAKCLPKASTDRTAVKQSIREKSHTLNFWQDTFALHVWELEQEFKNEVENYMNDVGVESAAYAITGWQPGSETESDDDDEE